MNFIVLTLVLLSIFSAPSAHVLKDIVLLSDQTQTLLKVSFSGTPEEGEYPLFFQKADASKGTIVLSFLETETTFPLGRHALDAGSPGIEEIQLRKMTSPSGKTFLSLELKMKEPPVGDAFVQPMPKGILQVAIGAGTKKKSTWTLSKSLKAREDYLNAHAEAAPGQAKALKGSSKNVVSEPSDAIKSAHEEGAELENVPNTNGLSSSKVFSVGSGSKAMITMMDSIEMKTQAGSKSATVKKIPLGTRVDRLDGKGSWMRVVEGADTGFIRTTAAVYADEMNQAQEKSLKSLMDAKQARITAKEASAAAKSRKAANAQLANPSEPAENPAPDADNTGNSAPKLAIADNPELADKLAREKKAADEEKMRVEPEEKRVTYNSYGRRDPFIPVEQGSVDNGIDIDQMKVVGIIYQSSEPMAVLEHTREANVSFTVKVGDPVHNGRVSRITREAVTFDISEYGISRSYSLKLVSSKEGTKK